MKWYHNDYSEEALAEMQKEAERRVEEGRERARLLARPADLHKTTLHSKAIRSRAQIHTRRSNAAHLRAQIRVCRLTVVPYRAQAQCKAPFLPCRKCSAVLVAIN